MLEEFDDGAVPDLTRGVVQYDHLLLRRPVAHVGMAEGSGKDVVVGPISMACIFREIWLVLKTDRDQRRG